MTTVRFEQTIERSFVHKLAISDVLVTDVARVGDRTLVLGAVWPRLHGFYRHLGGRYDVMLIAETLRQCFLVAAHRVYDVPLQTRFTMQELAFDVRHEALVVGPEPAQIHVGFEIGSDRRRGGELAELGAELTFEIDGAVVATGRGTASCLPEEVYRRLRWSGAPPRPPGRVPTVRGVPPTAVGQWSPDNVVVGDGYEPSTHVVRSPVDNAVLFDHPSDHVPGMVLLEAARQATRLHTRDPSARLRSITARFTRFVELDSICTIRPASSITTSDHPEEISFIVEQDETVCATIEVKWHQITGSRD